MRFILLRSLRIESILFLIFILTACNGGGGGGGGANNANLITVSGVVLDASDVSAIPAAGVLVTMRNVNNTVIASVISAGDGSYSFANVPASTDFYINTSKAGYVNCNSQVFNVTATETIDVMILSLASAKQTADAIYGSAGGSSWSDTFYSGKSWFGLDFVNGSGASASGLTISSAPSNTTIKYNNGADIFSAIPPSAFAQNEPLIGGYSASAGLYVFSPSNGSGIKLPLIKGEVSYALSFLSAHILSPTAINSGNPNTLYAITASTSRTVAVGSLGTIITSSDGLSWQTSSSNVVFNLNGVATSGTNFVAVGDLGTIVTSPDLINWTPQTSGTTKHLHGVAWTGVQFIAVGDTGTILTSSDAVTWTARTSGTTSDLYGAAANSAINIVVGAGNTILTSPTGLT